MYLSMEDRSIFFVLNLMGLRHRAQHCSDKKGEKAKSSKTASEIMQRHQL